METVIVPPPNSLTPEQQAQVREQLYNDKQALLGVSFGQRPKIENVETALDQVRAAVSPGSYHLGLEQASLPVNKRTLNKEPKVTSVHHVVGLLDLVKTYGFEPHINLVDNSIKIFDPSQAETIVGKRTQV